MRFSSRLAWLVWTAAKVELGKLLYFDGRLSRDGTVSCATCHDPAKGFTDLLAFLRSLEGDWKPVAPPALPQ